MPTQFRIERAGLSNQYVQVITERLRLDGRWEQDGPPRKLNHATVLSVWPLQRIVLEEIPLSKDDPK